MTTTDPIGHPLIADAPERTSERTPERTIEVLEETVRIEKRLVESDHARVTISVTERDQSVEAMLMRQDLAIERVPVGKVVTEAPPTRREGDTMIIPVMEELLVVEKRLVLKEELHIRIAESRHTETQVVRLRSEHAAIDHGAPVATTP